MVKVTKYKVLKWYNTILMKQIYGIDAKIDGE